jgi:hypothetical protein
LHSDISLQIRDEILGRARGRGRVKVNWKKDNQGRDEQTKSDVNIGIHEDKKKGTMIEDVLRSHGKAP